MKAQPLVKVVHDGKTGYEPCEIGETTHLLLNMPGPIPNRVLPVQTYGTRRGTGNWSWNGDTEKPTLKPSIKTEGVNNDGSRLCCHSFVNDGKVQFLIDSTHELAGTTVPLLDID